MKKLILLLFSILLISCFKEPRKTESSIIEKESNVTPPIKKEKIIFIEKDSNLLTLDTLVTLFSKDYAGLREWIKNNSYSIIDDGFYNHLSIESPSTSIIIDICQSCTRCSSISIFRTNEGNFKSLLKEAENKFTKINYEFEELDSAISHNCFSNGKVKITFEDKSAVDKKFEIKEDDYYSLSIETI